MLFGAAKQPFYNLQTMMTDVCSRNYRLMCRNITVTLYGEYMFP